MRRPSGNAPAIALHIFGLDHLTVLGYFDQTKVMVGPFTEVNDPILTCIRAREDAEFALAALRAMVRIVDMVVDDLVRLLSLAAEQADGGRRGAVFNSLFPDGFGPIIVPAGAKEIKALGKLVDRLEESDKAKSLREEWVPKVKQGKASYEKALADRTNGVETLVRARTALEMARDSWFDAIERHQGFIQMTYPRNRRMQDLFFAPRRRSKDTITDGGEPAGDGGDSPPAGGGSPPAGGDSPPSSIVLEQLALYGAFDRFSVSFEL
jgi:hypothetical protein